MIILENHNLKSFNTFGIQAQTRYFSEISSSADLQELQQTSTYKTNSKLILGGGSNILFTKDFDGLVVKNNLKGIEVTKEDDTNVYVKCFAGESWHQFVLWCIDHDYAGLENLSLIPGCVGASPMQNIGAYGVEIKDVFHELEAMHINTGEIVTFSNNACEFGYRESVFKRQYKNQFIIISVTYKLNKKPLFNTTYGAIQQELDKMGIKELSITAVSQAVIAIRSSKLPNPNILGNAGSFFKNPEVSKEKENQLKINYPHLVSYELENGNYKLAAGWLIEQCGFKGQRKGDAGVHTLQALVLVNYGSASGTDIFNLSQDVIDAVQIKFGVILEREVNII